MRLSLPTVHVVDRFGRDEDGLLHPDNVRKSVERLVHLGATNIELMLDAFTYQPDQFGESMIAYLSALKEENGITFTAHLPFKYSDVSALDEDIREASVRGIVQSIQYVERLDIEAFTVHVLSYTTGKLAASAGDHGCSADVKNLIIDDMLAQSGKSLRQLGEHVQSRRITVENLPFTSIDKIYSLADQCKCSYCLDTGKAAITGDNPVDVLQGRLSGIRVIHLHDSVKRGDMSIVDHQPLGSGFVPIEQLFVACKENRYDGPVVLEVLNDKNLVAGLEYLRKKGFIDDKMSFV